MANLSGWGRVFEPPDPLQDLWAVPSDRPQPPDAAILAIVLVKGVIGFLQEVRAGQALDALTKLSSPQAKVYREERLQTLPARDLVPGDFLVRESGDHVPAVMRLFEFSSLEVQEAALTGESVPVDNDASSCLPTGTPLRDRRNMAFLGAVVAGGKAIGVVVAIGMVTQLGRIAGLWEQTRPEPTPLQRHLSELGILAF